ncbi:MAG: YwqG family protein [Planctomycetaceae bacterium]
MGLNLLELIKPAVRFRTERIPQAQFGLGESRFGGIPDLPEGFDWPRWKSSEQHLVLFPPQREDGSAPLGFLAQLDLQQLPRIDERLPDKGWLYFFFDRHYEPWGFDPADRGSCRVIYVDGDSANLTPTSPPDDAYPEHIEEACRLETSLQLTLPYDLESIDYPSPRFDAYLKLTEELHCPDESPLHHLFGHPQVIQTPMELECQLASNGINCGTSEGYQSAEAETLTEGAGDWLLLFQIDTDTQGPGWMWGDAGRLYFWIRKQDLEAHRFEDVWLIFQCG